MSKLPTVFHGMPDPNDREDTDLTQAALEALIDRLNELPTHLIRRVVSSFVLTVCANQTDPVGMFWVLGQDVSSGLETHLAKPVGNG